MDLTNDSLAWSSEDVSVLRTFFQTETGKRFLPKVLENAPMLLRSGDTNAILIRNGEVVAWGEAARCILVLAAPPPLAPDQATHSRSYPDPTDDSFWADGQKTT